MRAIAVLFISALPMLAQTQDFAPPPPNTPDEATLKLIKEKTAELKKTVEGLQTLDQTSNGKSKWHDVAIYLKAAEWMQRHQEWYAKETGKQTLTVLDAGLKRAEALKAGKTPWRDVRSKPVIRAYKSEIDGSLQPYSVTLPAKYDTANRDFRVDILLHGRDATISEVKFLASRENAKASSVDPETIIIEPFGRGNNAYRWAGETDVFEAHRDMEHYAFDRDQDDTHMCLRGNRIILRGFSMGGAGTWHIGLHHPFEFRVMSPGAGFTVTRGYIKNLPEKLPDYQERCLHIYDAVDCEENLSIIPCVAYSGEKDPQIAAVRNIEARLKGFDGKPKFTHLIGTGLEHKMPPEWWAKVDAKIREHLHDPIPQSFRYVLWTPRYGETPAGTVLALETLYAKASVEGGVKDEDVNVKTVNIRVFDLNRPLKDQQVIEVDGQRLKYSKADHDVVIIKEKGQWRFWNRKERPSFLFKRNKCQGPIDDAFMEQFAIIAPATASSNTPVDDAIRARLSSFEKVWDKYLRAKLPIQTAEDPKKGYLKNLVLFGDVSSNPVLAKYAPKLPFTWSSEKLEVNGKQYDAKTHFPVMIYPHPEHTFKYLVINSGHTFGEADFKGTNALLYPRLGDWAVLKLAPTKEDPHHTEVVDAGIFDENWQFEKK